MEPPQITRVKLCCSWDIYYPVDSKWRKGILATALITSIIKYSMGCNYRQSRFATPSLRNFLLQENHLFPSSFAFCCNLKTFSFISPLAWMLLDGFADFLLYGLISGFSAFAVSLPVECSVCVFCFCHGEFKLFMLAAVHCS